MRSFTNLIELQVLSERYVLAKPNVETATIAERFLAGDSTSALADDFGIDEASIQEAIRFEHAFRSAAE